MVEVSRFSSVLESTVVHWPLHRANVCSCSRGLSSSYGLWTSQTMAGLKKHVLQKRSPVKAAERARKNRLQRRKRQWGFMPLCQPPLMSLACIHTKQNNYLSPSTVQEETRGSPEEEDNKEEEASDKEYQAGAFLNLSKHTELCFKL